MWGSSLAHCCAQRQPAGNVPARPPAWLVVRGWLKRLRVQLVDTLLGADEVAATRQLETLNGSQQTPAQVRGAPSLPLRWFAR